jgi:hypothetical protein
MKAKSMKMPRKLLFSKELWQLSIIFIRSGGLYYI